MTALHVTFFTLTEFLISSLPQGTETARL